MLSGSLRKIVKHHTYLLKGHRNASYQGQPLLKPCEIAKLNKVRCFVLIEGRQPILLNKLDRLR